MGRRRDTTTTKSYTLPSSPTHSFSSTSSSDFEFNISLSPRKSSAANLCPADELFYKGQLLPLHLSPRISMVRTLLLASSSSSDTSTTASRDSTGSSTDSHSSFSTDLLLDCDSSRPSSATEDEDFKRFTTTTTTTTILNHTTVKKSKYFSLSRFSNVFRKEPKTACAPDLDSSPGPGPGPVKRMSATAKEVIRKYLKKVKPLYEKLSQNDRQQMSRHKNVATRMFSSANINKNSNNNNNFVPEENDNATISHSFSDNLKYPKRRSCVASCPSSMRSSPTHSGVLSRNGLNRTSKNVGASSYADSSSMEELQSAIQGAIAHCKNSMLQNKSMVSDEIGVAS